MTKLVLESESQHTKEINKQENVNSQQNFVVFLAGRDSENKITELLHRKGKKKKKKKKKKMDKSVILMTGSDL